MNKIPTRAHKILKILNDFLRILCPSPRALVELERRLRPQSVTAHPIIPA